MTKMWKVALLMVVASFFLGLPGAFAGKLDDIKARGTLIAGVKDSQPPLRLRRREHEAARRLRTRHLRRPGRQARRQA